MFFFCFAEEKMTQWGLKGDLTRVTRLALCKKCNIAYNIEDKKLHCEIRQVTSNLIICSENSQEQMVTMCKRSLPNTWKAVIPPLSPGMPWGRYLKASFTVSDLRAEIFAPPSGRKHYQNVAP